MLHLVIEADHFVGFFLLACLLLGETAFKAFLFKFKVMLFSFKLSHFLFKLSLVLFHFADLVKYLVNEFFII